MLVDNELNKLNLMMLNVLTDKSNNISTEIKNYISRKSKRLRPVLIFLFSKALGIEITDKIYNLACAVELIHNATLIHDDIIDNALIRRSEISLNAKLGNGLSILSGDILLSIALQQLAYCENSNIIDVFSNSLYEMCKGEINQYSSAGTILSIEDYVKKSEKKTAELFKASLVSLCYLANLNRQIDNIYSFAKNFGTAFQIKDDLINITDTDETKPSLSDIYNGLYTAPVIYLNEDKQINSLSKEKISELVQNKKYVKKTIDLIKTYGLEALKSIVFIPYNNYKQKIIEITENLYKEGKDE